MRTKRNRPSARRLAFAAFLTATFLVMASLFAPHVTQARGAPALSVPVVQPAYADGPAAAPLPLLGELEGRTYSVKVYGSSDGPLYSIYNNRGRVIAMLLTAPQVSERFPQLHIPEAWAEVPESFMDGGVAR